VKYSFLVKFYFIILINNIFTGSILQINRSMWQERASEIGIYSNLYRCHSLDHSRAI